MPTLSLLALLCLDPDAAQLPPLSDLDRLPGRWECCEQAERCAQHLDRLRACRAVRGWEGGRWDELIRRTEFARAYWLTLESARGDFGVGERGQRRRLAALRDLVGPGRYLEGWSPPRLDEYPVKPAKQR